MLEMIFFILHNDFIIIYLLFFTLSFSASVEMALIIFKKKIFERFLTSQ